MNRNIGLCLYQIINILNILLFEDLLVPTLGNSCFNLTCFSA